MKASASTSFLFIAIVFLCGQSIAIAQGPSSSEQIPISSDQCARWKVWGMENSPSFNTSQLAYDTLRRYIDSCAIENDSYKAFGYLNSTFSWGVPNSRYPAYREWLKSVLFLNPSDRYYCADLGSILGSYSNYIGTNGYDYNASIAVLDYIAKCGRCDTISYWVARTNLRDQQRTYYEHTVTDTINNPLDTTLPSLESLGLGLVRNAVAAQPEPSDSEILFLSATENPFSSRTMIEYELADIDVAEVEVFDLLGQSVYTGSRRTHVGGKQQEVIDLTPFPQGTYYARLSTAQGNSQTIKLVKR